MEGQGMLKAENLPPAHKLKSELLRNYYPTVRPIYNRNQPTNVTVDLVFQYIVKLVSMVICTKWFGGGRRGGINWSNVRVPY